jgi:hypothetical protein
MKFLSQEWLERARKVTRNTNGHSFEDGDIALLLLEELLEAVQILEITRKMRAIAAPYGSMHAWWDVITDMEEFVRGRPTIVTMTAAEWIEYGEDLLKKYEKKCHDLCSNS